MAPPMPTQRTGKNPSRPRAPGRARRCARRAPLLGPDEVHAALVDLAGYMAPADVTAMMGREQELRERAAALTAPQLALLRDQLAVALDCLRDHVAGNCPQIPYSTISLLAAGVCYFADELDLVPDFLSRIGSLDDGAVMAMAFQLGADGIRRYCTATGRDANIVLGLASAHRPPAHSEATPRQDD
jgi:uncharacterized membrane protein YkvA (DUF1232 family)